MTSMSGKGNCYDNAMVETFFKTLTSEVVWRTAFQTRAEAIAALALYIDGFYNPRRRHSALGFTSPTQFERSIAHQTALHSTEAKSRAAMSLLSARCARARSVHQRLRSALHCGGS